MGIHLTDAARMRMREYLDRDAGALGVRFGIRRTGCSGYGYTVDLAHRIDEDDTVFDEAGIRLVVAAKALPFIDGTEIDFAREGINASFVFRNPNVTGECGCGESFTVAAPADAS
jgi:iron-sulfur cluster assembly protein